MYLISTEGHTKSISYNLSLQMPIVSAFLHAGQNEIAFLHLYISNISNDNQLIGHANSN